MNIISTLSSPVSPNAALASSSTVPLYILKHALKADIMLAMKCVVSHYSHKSMDEFPDLLKTFFFDSDIAKEVQLGRTKVGYVINYGLKKYYYDKMMEKVKSANHFTICFDEALNNISNRKQLDAHVLFFNEDNNKVERYYIGSSFMGHGDHELRLQKLKLWVA